MTPSDFEALIAQLDNADSGERKRVGDLLLSSGRAAVSPLIASLRSESPRIRQSAAFLLGALPAATESTAALEQALTVDTDAKVRKNAAVALGRHGAASSVAALAISLREETVGWVRPSIVLALGAIGGAEASAALSTVSAQTSGEQEALRKALEHTQSQPQPAAWRQDGGWRPALLLEVPIGLERVAISEVRECRFPTPTLVEPGIVRCRKISPRRLSRPGYAAAMAYAFPAEKGHHCPWISLASAPNARRR